MRLQIFFKIGLSLKSNDFDFEIVNFPFLDGDVPRSPSYDVYISQLIRFAIVCSKIDDFNNRTLFLIAKLLKQGYRYHKIRKAFSKLYHRHSELIVKYNIGYCISEPMFYGDLVFMRDVMRMRGQWTCFLSLSLQRRKIFIYNMILDLDLIKLMNKM